MCVTSGAVEEKTDAREVGLQRARHAAARHAVDEADTRAARARRTKAAARAQNSPQRAPRRGVRTALVQQQHDSAAATAATRRETLGRRFHRIPSHPTLSRVLPPSPLVCCAGAPSVPRNSCYFRTQSCRRAARASRPTSRTPPRLAELLSCPPAPPKTFRKKCAVACGGLTAREIHLAASGALYGTPTAGQTNGRGFSPRRETLRCNSRERQERASARHPLLCQRVRDDGHGSPRA